MNLNEIKPLQCPFFVIDIVIMPVSRVSNILRVSRLACHLFAGGSDCDSYHYL